MTMLTVGAHGDALPAALEGLANNLRSRPEDLPPAIGLQVAAYILLAAREIRDLTAALTRAHKDLARLTPDTVEEIVPDGPEPAKHRHRFAEEGNTRCACGAWKRGHGPAPAVSP
jgi:hypothetical protein